MEQRTQLNIPDSTGAMMLILQGATKLDEENKQLRASEAAHRAREAELENEVCRLKNELEKERQEKAYYRGLLEGVERATRQQHVENNYYNDRTTLIRDSGLPDANIQMQVLKKTSDNNIDSY